MNGRRLLLSFCLSWGCFLWAFAVGAEEAEKQSRGTGLRSTFTVGTPVQTGDNATAEEAEPQQLVEPQAPGRMHVEEQLWSSLPYFSGNPWFLEFKMKRPALAGARWYEHPLIPQFVKVPGRKRWILTDNPWDYRAEHARFGNGFQSRDLKKRR